MSMSITQDIRSITDLKRNTTEIIDQIHSTGRSVVVTINGRAEVVLVDAAEYENMTAALLMRKLVAPAEADIAAGRVRDASVFFKEFKRAKKI